MRKLVVLLLKAYKLGISPFMPNACRYEPTCANYAIEAVQIHGVLRGSWLAVKRIARCHPGYEGGLDPVPETGVLQSKNQPKT